MKTRAHSPLWCALFVLLAAFAFVSGCSSPIVRVTPSGPGSNQLPTLAAGETPQPVLLERRLIVLEWPQTMREKDSDLIVLSITMDEAGRVTPTVAAPGPNDEGTPVDIPDLYETHNIVAVARLDMAGLEAYREDMREPLRPGRTVTFRWSVRAGEPGRYRGVVWLHVELVPKAGGNIEEILLMARPIEINAVTVLGMPGNLARLLGMLGVLASTALGYPFIQKWLDTLRARRPTPEPLPSPPEKPVEKTAENLQASPPPSSRNGESTGGGDDKAYK